MYLKYENKEKDAWSGPFFNSKWTACFKPLVWKIGNCTYRQPCQTTLNVRMRTDKTISFLQTYYVNVEYFFRLKQFAIIKAIFFICRVSYMFLDKIIRNY